MAIVRWQPFDLLGDGFEDLVRRTFGDFGTSLLQSRGETWAPAMDARVEGDELRVRLELPGIDPDNDVDIDVDGGVLHIVGERKQEQTSEGEGWHRREMRYGRFERHLALPEGVDPASVRATYDRGILEVTVPLPAKPRAKVKVEVGTRKELKE